MSKGPFFWIHCMFWLHKHLKKELCCFQVWILILVSVIVVAWIVSLLIKVKDVSKSIFSNFPDSFLYLFGAFFQQGMPHLFFFFLVFGPFFWKKGCCRWFATLRVICSQYCYPYFQETQPGCPHTCLFWSSSLDSGGCMLSSSWPASRMYNHNVFVDVRN